MAQETPMGARILLVEDESIVALSERRTLEENGYRVSVARSGEDALELARTDKAIRLVLMDIDLGRGIDGPEAAKLILGERTLPIVFLTGHAEREYVDRARSITNYGYVLKTSGEFVLLEAIRMAFELFRLNQDLRRERDLFESIADLTGEIIVRHDSDGVWTFVNAFGRGVWGLGETRPAELNYLDFVHEDDREQTKRVAQQMRETRTTVLGLVNRQKTVNGLRTYEWNSHPIINEANEFEGFQATGRDITDRRQA
jgi:PAS domain S-box-containing protein